MEALTGMDLATLGERQSSIKRIRDHHHRLAILVAQGKRTGEIAEETGMSISRVSILKSDPAFQQLVAAYREQHTAIVLDVYKNVMAKRAAIEELSLEVIEERLAEQDETISLNDLLAIQADMADRLGRAKVSRTERLNMNVDLADGLAEARRRELQLSASVAPPEQRSDAEKPESVSSPPAEPPTPAGEGE